MSNKITNDSVDAFLNKTKFQRENMRVDTYDDASRLVLHNNVIAISNYKGVYISTSGWQTRTTLMRLREVLRRVAPQSRLQTKKGILYLNDQQWNGNFTLINN